jgi:hypothetical protein
MELETELEESRRAMDAMQDDLRRRKESYMRREEGHEREVESLNEELRILKGERASDTLSAKGKSKDTIKTLHGQITSELENLLMKQEVALSYNASVTIRSYADKLNAYEAQIERDKELKGNSLAQWMERTAALRAENDTTREIAMVIDAKYKERDEECTRLRAEFKAQEDDRAILLSQMVKLRTENKKLSLELVTQSQELMEVKEERDNLLQTLHAYHSQSQSQGFLGHRESSEAESELRETQKASAMRQLLEVERKKTREAQSALELQSRRSTELYTLLQGCLEDCREKMLLSSRGRTAINASNRPSSAMPSSTRRPYSGHTSTASRPFSALNSESRDSFVDELVKREALLLQVLGSLGAHSGQSTRAKDARPISATVRPPLPSQFQRPRSALTSASDSAPMHPTRPLPDDDFIIDEGDEEELCVPNPSVQHVTSKQSTRQWIFDASALHRDHLSSGGGGQAAKPRSAGGKLGSWGRPVSAVGKT